MFVYYFARVSMIHTCISIRQHSSLINCYAHFVFPWKFDTDIPSPKELDDLRRVRHWFITMCSAYLLVWKHRMKSVSHLIFFIYMHEISLCHVCMIYLLNLPTNMIKMSKSHLKMRKNNILIINHYFVLIIHYKQNTINLVWQLSYITIG